MTFVAVGHVNAPSVLQLLLSGSHFHGHLWSGLWDCIEIRATTHEKCARNDHGKCHLAQSRGVGESLHGFMLTKRGELVDHQYGACKEKSINFGSSWMIDRWKFVEVIQHGSLGYRVCIDAAAE